jgi:YegS/Rv2252/BmrU family lipid kinase
MPRRARLIVNPSSGGGRALAALPRVRAALRRLGVDFDEHATRSLEHGCELAREGADADRTLVTLSGDGLVGAVAGAVAGRLQATLAVLPGGRGNDLARALGIPLDDLDAACAIVRDGRAVPLDVGLVGDRAFVGIASFGFDSDANRIANQAPAWLGRGVYAYGALRALAAWRPARFELAVDGGAARTVEGYSVALANSPFYGGGMRMAPGARLDDGLLDVVVIKRCSKARFVSQLPKVFSGDHVANPEIEVLRARSVEVRADRPFTIYADGDPIGDLPAAVSVQAHAVSVLVAAR